MPVRLTIGDLLRVLAITPRSQNVLLVGRHGIGKSEILTTFFQSHGLRVVPLFLGQMADPGDLLGLPQRNMATGHTEFLPPTFWPDDATPMALFLDELNRARPEILQAVHELALNRTLAGRRLPEESTVLAAVNAGDDYQVTDLDPALVARFNVYELAPEVDEWLSWAIARPLDDRLTSFIVQSPGQLDGTGARTHSDLDRTPDRRAWVRVASIIKGISEIDDVVTKAIAGIVGVEAAVAFAKHCNSKGRLSIERLLTRFDSDVERALDRHAVPELVAVNREILQWLEQNAPKLVSKKRASTIAHVEKYIDYLKRAERTEAIADLVNQFDKLHFARASAMLLESTTMLDTLERYIGAVKL